MDFELETKLHLEMTATYLQDILDQVRELQVKVDQLAARSTESNSAAPGTFDGDSRPVRPGCTSPATVAVGSV